MQWLHNRKTKLCEKWTAWAYSDLHEILHSWVGVSTWAASRQTFMCICGFLFFDVSRSLVIACCCLKVFLQLHTPILPALWNILLVINRSCIEDSQKQKNTVCCRMSKNTIPSPVWNFCIVNFWVFSSFCCFWVEKACCLSWYSPFLTKYFGRVFSNCCCFWLGKSCCLSWYCPFLTKFFGRVFSNCCCFWLGKACCLSWYSLFLTKLFLTREITLPQLVLSIFDKVFWEGILKLLLFLTRESMLSQLVLSIVDNVVSD